MLLKQSLIAAFCLVIGFSNLAQECGCDLEGDMKMEKSEHSSFYRDLYFAKEYEKMSYGEYEARFEGGGLVDLPKLGINFASHMDAGEFQATKDKLRTYVEAHHIEQSDNTLDLLAYDDNALKAWLDCRRLNTKGADLIMWVRPVPNSPNQFELHYEFDAPPKPSKLTMFPQYRMREHELTNGITIEDPNGDFRNGRRLNDRSSNKVTITIPDTERPGNRVVINTTWGSRSFNFPPTRDIPCPGFSDEKIFAILDSLGIPKEWDLGRWSGPVDHAGAYTKFHAVAKLTKGGVRFDECRRHVTFFVDVTLRNFNEGNSSGNWNPKGNIIYQVKCEADVIWTQNLMMLVNYKTEAVSPPGETHYGHDRQAGAARTLYNWMGQNSTVTLPFDSRGEAQEETKKSETEIQPTPTQ